VEDILAVLKVPKTEVFKYDDVRKETAEVQDRALWTKNLVPHAMYLEDELWASLFSRKLHAKVWGLFDMSQVHALQDNINTKTDTATKLFALGVPLNAINERLDLGLEPVPWGDVGFLPFSLTPIGDAPPPPEDDLRGPGGARPLPDENEPEAVPPPADDDDGKQWRRPITRGKPGLRWVDKVAVPRAATRQLIVTRRTEATQKARGWSPAQRARLWRTFTASLQGLESRFASRLRRFFFTLRQDVLDQLFRLTRDQASTTADRFVLLLDTKKSELRGFAGSFYDQAAQAGLQRLAEFDLSFTVQDPRVQRLIRERTDQITSIVDTLEVQLCRQLVDGLRAGEPVGQVADGLVEAPPRVEEQNGRARRRPRRCEVGIGVASRRLEGDVLSH
jgi:hypothetical protein